VSKQKHLLDETARVLCQMRARDVDIEVCLACRHLESYDLDSRRPFIVCTGPEQDRAGSHYPGA
jgi:hypothetical protein